MYFLSTCCWMPKKNRSARKEASGAKKVFFFLQQFFHAHPPTANHRYGRCFFSSWPAKKGNRCDTHRIVGRKNLTEKKSFRFIHSFRPIGRNGYVLQFMQAKGRKYFRLKKPSTWVDGRIATHERSHASRWTPTPLSYIAAQGK